MLRHFVIQAAASPLYKTLTAELLKNSLMLSRIFDPLQKTHYYSLLATTTPPSISTDRERQISI